MHDPEGLVYIVGAQTANLNVHLWYSLIVIIKKLCIYFHERCESTIRHDLELAQSLINSSGVKKLIDAIYQKPIFTAQTIVSIAEVSEATCRKIFDDSVKPNYFL